MIPPRLPGPIVELRPLSPDDVTPTYLGWMTDPEVNRFLEARFLTHTLDSIRTYVCEANEHPHDVMFGIFEPTSRHVGNLRLGLIHPIHRTGEIGIMIGEKDCWGRGYATAAIRLLCAYAFQSLGLRKVTAGAYADNVGSIAAFAKVGFTREGLLRGQYTIDEVPTDCVRLGLLATEFRG